MLSRFVGGVNGIDANHRAEVNSTIHTIKLYTFDIKTRSACTEKDVCDNNFRTVPHEYGHSMTKKMRHGFQTRNLDEYLSVSPYISDTKSIMNIGRELRTRHIVATIEALNELMRSENVTFSVRNV
jgi:hypothetical protein